jgi:hypothetical protein
MLTWLKGKKTYMFLIAFLVCLGLQRMGVDIPRDVLLALAAGAGIAMRKGVSDASKK